MELLETRYTQVNIEFQALENVLAIGPSTLHIVYVATIRIPPLLGPTLLTMLLYNV